MKNAVLSRGIKGAVNDLPDVKVMKSNSNTGVSAEPSNVVKPYLQAQVSYNLVGESRSELIVNTNRGTGQGFHIGGTAFNIASIGLTSKECIPLSVRYSDEDLEIVVAESYQELQSKIKVALRENKIRAHELGLKIKDLTTKVWKITPKLGKMWLQGKKSSQL